MLTQMTMNKSSASVCVCWTNVVCGGQRVVRTVPTFLPTASIATLGTTTFTWTGHALVLRLGCAMP